MTESGHPIEKGRHLQRIESALTARAEVGPDTTVLTFEAPVFPRRLRPGQFFMVKIQSPGFPLFGRAFSIFDYRVSGERAELDFLVQAVGRGTAMLNSAPIGSDALLVGPAGNGFPAIAAGQKTILVGGGTGIAPLHHLLADLARSEMKGMDVLLLHGARNRASLYVHDRLKALPYPVEVSTEDGSLGVRGMVDLLLEDRIKDLEQPECARILACGPNPMMRAVAHIGERCGIPTYLSLETRMACGTGICNGCVVAVENGTPPERSRKFLRVCHEGPVFLSTILPDFRLSGGVAATGESG